MPRRGRWIYNKYDNNILLSAEGGDSRMSRLAISPADAVSRGLGEGGKLLLSGQKGGRYSAGRLLEKEGGAGGGRMSSDG